MPSILESCSAGHLFCAACSEDTVEQVAIEDEGDIVKTSDLSASAMNIIYCPTCQAEMPCKGVKVQRTDDTEQGQRAASAAVIASQRLEQVRSVAVQESSAFTYSYREGADRSVAHCSN